jgi:type IV pilus assembly protein PilQ
MGSLARKNNFILLAAVLAMLWAGLFASRASAATNVEQRKMLLLELLGLDTSDTEVIRTAREAQSLFAVDVMPSEDNISVVLKLSDLPEYDSHLYTKDKRRLVVDLANTINLAPTSVFMLGEEDPIQKVRNSQYRVSPRYISRIVIDLDEETEPEISSEGTNLVISAPVGAVMLAAASDDAVDQAEPVAEPVASEAETAEVVEEKVEPVEEIEETPQAEPAPEPEPVVAEVAEEKVETAAMVAMTEETEEPVAEAPAELEPLIVEEPAPEETLLTLTFRDADLNAVLDIIARKGKLNIIAGKDIRGAVTVRLVDVPLDVALNAILSVNGYGYVKSKNIIRIVPLSQLGEEVETTTATYTLSYADATKAKDTLRSFLTPNGSIEIDARTNMLIVTDVPGNMERIAKLIPKIDKRVQQVLIEVLILDSVLTDDADLGVTWNVFDTSDNSVGIAGNQDGANQLFGLADPTALNVNYATLLGAVHLEALVQAVVRNGDSRVLANPKLLTLNNETASIEIITEFPYQERTSTGEGGNLVSTSFKDVGTKMDVKPQITHDGHVILNLVPEQSNVVDFDPTNIPIVATRKTATTLIVKDHQTIVVGGLRENKDVVTMKKVPVLGDLPVAKYVFRSVTSRKQDTELLVFITVHIVESPSLVPSEKIKFDELGTLPRMPNSSIELIR